MATYTARRGWQRFLQARIPTLLGLGILLLGVVVGIVLLGQGTTGFLPRASEDTVPRQIRITNITDTSFTVSFLTDGMAPGYVEHGTEPNQLKQQVRDDRDQLANSTGTFTTHHITVRGLQPSKQYYFRIGTGTREMYDNNGAPFSLRTARPTVPGSEARTAYGTINTEVGNPADGAIVYLTIEGASPLSAQVKTDGSWALPLSSVQSLDLSGTIKIEDTTPVKIEVQGSRRTDSLQLTATVGDLVPLQTLQFGQVVEIEGRQALADGTDADVELTDTGAGTDSQTEGRQQTDQTIVTSTDPSVDNDDLPDEMDDPDGTGGQPESSTEVTAESGDPDGFDTLYDQSEATQVTGPNEVDVRLDEGEVINTTQPEFQGVAPAGGLIQIEVHSEEPYYGVAKADAEGQWNWTPPADLEPGEHTITVTYIDEQGQQQRIQRNFIVQASTGNTPAFTATPSGTIATPTPTPTPTPTMIAQATPVPTAVPTSTPSATPMASASAQPVSGGTTLTWALVAVAVTCFILGGGATAWGWTTREAGERA